MIGREARYSNNPSDKGGETMWGITVARARAAGDMGPMAATPRQTAVDICARFYIRQRGFDLIGDLLPDPAAGLQPAQRGRLPALDQPGRHAGSVQDPGRDPGGDGALRP
ncbi:hypothetical protein J5Y10_26725 [Roseomonas sp. SG15]|uniref:TtsA-like Glycoside hydrolase family 108 domain-containing protein n=1 Tax=Roseomonas indoligenes TaxID=2820811 RepID=A0A940N4E6_9PROT|nr:hypothetical protein [Pararoseomonas indoligenes]